MEGGPGGATWGKRRLRVRVPGPGGGRAGFLRAALRSVVKFLPWELAHASIWLMVLPSRVPPAAAQAGVVAALALAAVWALGPLAGAGGRSVYDWVSGTRVVSAG